jgi:dihydromethanopterin reductase (acceptor)
MEILWCVTGAGHLLNESFRSMDELPENHRITVAFSNAGYEVTRMYGLLDHLKRDLRGVILEQEQGFSSPLVGRLAKREYDMVVVAPCTANTVATVVNGIADSLVSNIIAKPQFSYYPRTWKRYRRRKSQSP